MKNFLVQIGKITLVVFIWKFALYLTGYLSFTMLPKYSEIRFFENISGFFSMWSVFDVGWFVGIADRGYAMDPASFVFFPLYPILIKVFSMIFQLNTVIGAQMVSIIFLIFAIYFLIKLLKIDFSDDICERTVLYILIFPTAFFLGIGYSESLFLFLVVASIYFARKQKWFLAGILAGLASATRLVGSVIFFVLLVEYLEQIKWNIRRIKPTILYILISLSGILLYSIYLKYYWGDPLKFLHAYEVSNWGKSAFNFKTIDIVFSNVKEILNFSKILNPSLEYAYAIIYLASFLGFLFLGVTVFLKIRKSYGIYILLSLAIIFLSGSLISINRYVLVFFPAFIVLAIFGKNKYLNWLISITFCLLLGFFAAIFVNGWWVA